MPRRRWTCLSSPPHPSGWPKGHAHVTKKRQPASTSTSTCLAARCGWPELVSVLEARKKKAADGKPCSLNRRLAHSLCGCASPCSLCFFHLPCCAHYWRPLLLRLSYQHLPLPYARLPVYLPGTTSSSRYNAAPIQHTYTHVHSPAVSDCSVSAQGLVHFSPKPSVLAPSLRLHAACLRPCRANGNSSLQAVQLINCPASGAQIGLVPFAQLVLSGRSRSQLSASRWSQLPSLSLIRTFYKPGPLPARHLALGEPPSCWSLTF